MAVRTTALASLLLLGACEADVSAVAAGPEDRLVTICRATIDVLSPSAGSSAQLEKLSETSVRITAQDSAVSGLGDECRVEGDAVTFPRAEVGQAPTSVRYRSEGDRILLDITKADGSQGHSIWTGKRVGGSVAASAAAGGSTD